MDKIDLLINYEDVQDSLKLFPIINNINDKVNESVDEINKLWKAKLISEKENEKRKSISLARVW